MNIFILAFIIAFEVSVVFFLMYTTLANKRRVYQMTRLLGPKEHRSKDGTITMGGIVFVSTTIIVYLLIGYFNNILIFYETLLILIAFLGMAMIGFIDDYLKVVRKNNDGIKGNLKMALQIIVSSLCFICFIKLGISTNVNLYFFNIDLKWMYGLLILFYIVGFSNASNLTDGLDGLCAGVSIIIFIFLFIICLKIENKNAAIFLITLISTLIGFLLFNFKKAIIFMGDTGSLAIGGVIGVLAVMLKLELLIGLISLVMVFETLSVIIQVGYFKLTKGKRIFRMAPLHHHFELLGMNERTVVIMFYLFGIMFGLISLYIGGII